VFAQRPCRMVQAGRSTLGTQGQQEAQGFPFLNKAGQPGDIGAGKIASLPFRIV
jgi:hypothetical protein